MSDGITSFINSIGDDAVNAFFGTINGVVAAFETLGPLLGKPFKVRLVLHPR